jgi:hypothetical protein
VSERARFDTDAVGLAGMEPVRRAARCDAGVVFDRFKRPDRDVVALARDEARPPRHNYVGAERGVAAALTVAAMCWAVLAGSVAAASPVPSCASQPYGAAALMDIPYCDGVLVDWATPSSAATFVFAFRVDPVSPGGGFQPGCTGPPSRGYMGVSHSGGTVSLLGQLSPIDSPAVVSKGRVAVVTYTRNCKGQSAMPDSIEPLERLSLRRGAVGALPRSSLLLSGDAEPGSPAVAVDRQGDLAVAWLVPHDEADELYISTGTINGPMSRPQVIVGRDDVVDVRLAWTSDRQLVVAYADASASQVRARTMRSGGEFSAPFTLGATEHSVDAENVDLSVAVGSGGRVAIAWGSDLAGIQTDSPWSVRATVRTRAGGAFLKARLLDPGNGDVDPLEDVAAQIGADGITTIGWSSAQGSYPVRYATVSAEGAFSPVRTIAPASYDYELGASPLIPKEITITPASGGSTLLQWETPADDLEESLRSLGAATYGTPTPTDMPAGAVDQVPVIDSAIGG